MTKDMTKGSPIKLIIAFSIPLLIGNVFQQFYNMVDAIIVGNYLGVDALAAVGATGSMAFLALGFAMGMTGGFSVIVAQCFGAEDYKQLRHVVAMSMILSAIITIALTILMVLGARPLLVLMKTPDNIIDEAYKYIVIIYAGLIVTMAYNLFSGILRALGDSKTPLYFLILSSILNIILDLVFVIALKVGVAGAAYATVIAQGISAILCYIYMMKKFPILHVKKEDWKFDMRTAIKMCNVGIPMALQFTVTAVGVMVLQSAINKFGSTVVGAYTAASKVEQLSTQPMMTLGTTMATYVGQNLGAGRYDRILSGMKSSFFLSLACAMFAFVVVYFGGEYVVRLFISNPKPEELGPAMQYLRTIAFFFPFLSLLFLYRNALQGLGQGFIPLMAGVAEFVMRIAVAFGLTEWLGYVAICIASPCAWIAAGLLLTIRYLISHRQMKKKMELSKQVAYSQEAI